MKIVKVIASFFILMLIGIFISYGDTDNSGYDKFLETFNNTQADFKFYNIKANGLINYDITKNEIKDICIDIINDLGLEESDIKWEEKWGDLAYKLGRAGGYVLAQGKDKVKVIVGKDTRVSGDMLEAALVAGLMSVGCDVVTVGVIPTPGVAYLTKKYEADCGVVISASHNPVEYNGIKFFNKDGYKLDDAVELEIEGYIDNIEKVDYHPVGEKVGRKIFVHNAQRDYIDYLKSIVNVDFKGLKVVLDCANGAAYKVAPTIFSELGANVVTINSEPDGNNINDKCGSTHPKKLQQLLFYPY